MPTIGDCKLIFDRPDNSSDGRQQQLMFLREKIEAAVCKQLGITSSQLALHGKLTPSIKLDREAEEALRKFKEVSA
jgi:hypothetical protein